MSVAGSGRAAGAPCRHPGARSRSVLRQTRTDFRLMQALCFCWMRVPVLRGGFGRGGWMGVVLVMLLGAAVPLHAQQVIPLTLEGAVDRAMQGSYRVRQLRLGIERTRSRLRAERAGLKSKVYMNLRVPEIAAISDNKWNSTLRQYEIVRENTRRWQMNVAIRQPVVLFGYPTNGYLSLNNTVYRYAQLGDEGGAGLDVQYYNRYFIRFEQPLFQPNGLKNAIEDAELNLEREELAFQEDIVQMLDDIADDYYDLFELAYKQVLFQRQVDDLERAAQLATERVRQDTSRAIEVSQVRVELANARERVSQARSNYRLAASRMKQRLNLDEADSLVVDPNPHVRPVDVDLEQAVAYGRSLRPQLRKLAIQRRKDEIDVNNARGWDSFRANLEVTYGRETQDPRFDELWERPTNSYSIGLYAYIPIWDWGRRRARIQAEQISLRKTELFIEETEREIRTDIANAIQNLEEYEQRAITMEENLQMARDIVAASMAQYRSGDISILDLLQSIGRQEDTALNFLTTYLGYRKALLSLQKLTYYDFERDMPLLRRFEIDGLAGM
ncbi:MAG: TolC family protein [Bacteroidetes bacterium]|nr:MAG: TolC family protein [Bacteroidota bacterium]